MQVADYKRCSMCAAKKPARAFYLDARMRSGLSSRCRRCNNSGGKRAKAAQATKNYALRVDASQRRARILAARIPKDWGNWLAGFIDGEGCFVVARTNHTTYVRYGCAMRLAVRADDRPILLEIQRRTGLGRIYETPANGNANPSSAWSVQSKGDVLALVAILDRFPLRAKKARDYAIWREAVLLWATNYRKRAAVNGIADWSEMASLREQLGVARAYRSH
jgi:hypothetical protein